jgi:hypothetical protein
VSVTPCLRIECLQVFETSFAHVAHRLHLTEREVAENSEPDLSPIAAPITPATTGRFIWFVKLSGWRAVLNN